MLHGSVLQSGALRGACVGLHLLQAAFFPRESSDVLPPDIDGASPPIVLQ